MTQRRLDHVSRRVMQAADQRTAGSDPDSTGAGATNLRLQQVVFTQVVQDSQGSLPLVSGVAAAAKVLVARSRESVDEVPLVLRLFRGGVIVYTDTAKTGGVLGPTASLVASSVEFLVPASFVAPDVSCQVEIDPRQTIPDSTRIDNLLPAVPAPLTVVTVPPRRLHLVPVILSRYDNIRGDVTAANAESYVRLARQILPAREMIVTVGEPVVSGANFGMEPLGADLSFWQVVLSQVDAARMSTGRTDVYWYGVVPVPAGFSQVTYGGYGYLPSSPGSAGAGSRSSVGLAISPSFRAQTAQMLVAHELGHNFGRAHAPGCSAPAPLDPLFPTFNGAILGIGHDVWSWASGLARVAPSVGAQTADIMSYCDAKWIGPYSYLAMMQWRMASTVTARISRSESAVAMP